MARKNRKKITWTLLVLIVTFSITIGLASMKKAPERKTEMDERIAVPVYTVENTEIQTSIPIIGKITARESIDIYAEVSGILEKTSKEFLEGVSYKKGETILVINSDETYQNLISSRSNLLNLITQILPELKFDYPESYTQWLNYLNKFDISKKTSPLPDPLNEQEKYYIAGKNIYQTYYNIISTETRLEKYIIHAPFDGVTAQTYIKPGSLVMNGQKLGEYFNPDRYDLEAEVSLSDLAFIKTGDEVHLTSDYTGGSFTGFVNRISQNVDSKTQTVKIYISVRSPELKNGEYLKGHIATSSYSNGIEIPRKLIVNNDEVLTIVNDTIIAHKVEIVRWNQNTAIVKGLKNGTLISEKTKGVHTGMAVKTTR